MGPLLQFCGFVWCRSLVIGERRPLYVVFGADGNGAWDDDDMAIIGFVDFIYLFDGSAAVKADLDTLP
ncbi:hypothetical protein D5086_022416 [Populus alba]|uniref:Uncharacterized protein n=1 Tax=Populus alba TaxID=43335 RepID=A0ACC4BEZ1_POPAL